MILDLICRNIGVLSLLFVGSGGQRLTTDEDGLKLSLTGLTNGLSKIKFFSLKSFSIILSLILFLYLLNPQNEDIIPCNL